MRPRLNAAAREQRTAEQLASRRKADEEAARRPSFEEIAERARAKGVTVSPRQARVHQTDEGDIRAAAQRLREGMPYEPSPSLRAAIDQWRKGRAE